MATWEQDPPPQAGREGQESAKIHKSTVIDQQRSALIKYET